MLDNSVAGGIASGTGVFGSLERECMEEAGLAAAAVRTHARAAGAVSYFYRSVRSVAPGRGLTCLPQDIAGLAPARNRVCVRHGSP
jgi:8-oxo-dGTP pyrophosphatase MutT (NUDIX family)